MPTMCPVRVLCASARVVSSGVTMPISNAGTMNNARTSTRLVLTIDSSYCCNSLAVTTSSQGIASADTPAATSTPPAASAVARRSAQAPPIALPIDKPARTTPITADQVYSDTPTCGAIRRAATISSTSSNAELTNTATAYRVIRRWSRFMRGLPQ